MNRSPIATRIMPGLYGTEIRVPAYVVAEPRKRGVIPDWLREKRAAAAKGSN